MDVRKARDDAVVHRWLWPIRVCVCVGGGRVLKPYISIHHAHSQHTQICMQIFTPLS
jgi:hypothetical protein